MLLPLHSRSYWFDRDTHQIIENPRTRLLCQWRATNKSSGPSRKAGGLQQRGAPETFHKGVFITSSVRPLFLYPAPPSVPYPYRPSPPPYPFFAASTLPRKKLARNKESYITFIAPTSNFFQSKTICFGV